MAGTRSRPRAAGRAGGGSARSAAQTARSDAVRSRRRGELIDATIKCIARSGLGGVTMQEITREAGLSLGIVNLHFDTKEKLLVETLRVIADEYRAGWRRILDSGAGAAGRLAALVDFDFSARVVDRGKLAVWFAYWGETRARPVYRRICAEVDRAIDDELCALCSELVTEGRYRGVDPERVAMTYSALTNGLWLDILVCPGEIDRGTARAICLDYLAGIFPRHFGSGKQQAQERQRQ
jgi:TetR/AcrR family transcriptional repressor of bet genes